MKTLNAYEITWIALVPVFGKPTKRDNNAISKVLGYKSINYFSDLGKALATFKPNKEAAKNIIPIIKGSLSKEYKVYMFTDKQFGLASKENADIQLWSDGRGIALTSFQKKEAYIIK